MNLMLNTTQITEMLHQGQLSLEGRFMWGSNYTLLVQIAHEGQEWPAVYKPTQGERPLWDFPADTLAFREAAAYLVSETLGWSLVPPTIYREDGPLGPGSLQYYIEHDPEYQFFSFSPEDRGRLQPVALFDLVINNADRKGGHLLVDPEDHIWAIDHGICFHEQPKLRTVIWDYAGEPLPDALCEDLVRFLELLAPETDFHQALSDLLFAREIKAMRQRIKRLLAAGKFPAPPTDSRPYPWPLV